MYRTASGGPSLDPLLVIPGDGIRDILVGGATPPRVLATFGPDARVDRYSTDGDIAKITYEYTQDDEYLPSRPGAESRPSYFTFEYGLLVAIRIGVYASELSTTGGIRIGSSKQDVLSVFGLDGTSLVSESFETLRYIALGIELQLSNRDQRVSSFDIFRKQRT